MRHGMVPAVGHRTGQFLTLATMTIERGERGAYRPELFVSLLCAVQPRSAQQSKAIFSFISSVKVASDPKILVVMTPSGSSFVAVLYISTEARDAAIVALGKEKLRWEAILDLIIAPFGVKSATTRQGC